MERGRSILRTGILLLAGICVSAGLAGELTGTVVDKSGNPLENAVLVAVPTEGVNAPPRKHSRQQIDQVNSEFVPFVKVVFVGDEVTFPNKDTTRHQVYSFSPPKRFELPLYAGHSAPPVCFDQPGVVVLGCNIHDWMVAYVYVSESPYFALTKTNGRASIDALPPGDYLVRVWHPGLKGNAQATVRRITVPAIGTVASQWQVALQADNRLRRHPGSGRSGY